MKEWQYRAVVTGAGVVLLILLSSVAYHWLVITVEGQANPYPQSLQVVVETYTGTGYGGHTTWDSTVANLFIIAMDLSTFLILFIILPYIFQPVISAALAPDIPTLTTETDHVVICGYSPRVQQLIEELRVHGTDYVVIVEDEDQAEDLVERDVSVVHGNPSAAETLDSAGVERASSVVVDIADVESVGTVLACRDLSEDLRIIVLGDGQEFEQHLQLAGATRVVRPKDLLGKRLAQRVKNQHRDQLRDRIELGESLALVELTVFENSPLYGMALESTALWTDDDFTVTGLWKSESFETTPDESVQLEGGDVLLIIGPDEKFDQLNLEGERPGPTETNICLAGYGNVGKAAMTALQSGDATYTIIDREDKDGVDVVGDVTERSTLEEADVEHATALILAIPNDDKAILATILARELDPEITVLARINETANKTKMQRAGADHIFSLPEISGKILVHDILGEHVLSYDRQIKVNRVAHTTLADETLEESSLLDTNATVVAIERAGEIRTDIDGSFRFEAGDDVVLVGTEEAIQEFESKYE